MGKRIEVRDKLIHAMFSEDFYSLGDLARLFSMPQNEIEHIVRTEGHRASRET